MVGANEAQNVDPFGLFNFQGFDKDMFKFEKDSNQPVDRPHNRIDCLIGENARVEGVINFSGGLRIEGEIVGHIKTEGLHSGTLVVSETGRVKGEINVSHAFIDGTIEGPITVSSLTLQKNSSITGNISYSMLEIDSGAVVQGQLSQSNVHEMETPDSMPIIKSAG